VVAAVRPLLRLVDVDRPAPVDDPHLAIAVPGEDAVKLPRTDTVGEGKLSGRGLRCAVAAGPGRGGSGGEDGADERGGKYGFQHLDRFSFSWPASQRWSDQCHLRPEPEPKAPFISRSACLRP